MELSSVSDHKQHEPISSAYEVGDPEREPPKPQRNKPAVLATPKQSKLRVHIREPQVNPPTPDVPPTAEHAKDTPTTDFKRGSTDPQVNRRLGLRGRRHFKKGEGRRLVT